ncbi:MAG: AroM family protein [Acetobacteraceae bacterium]|nr:AroM family protein [Acetobacteraceae bacterium]
MSVLRVLAIGQSPRPDMEAEIAAAVPGVPIALQGALDGWTREQIAAIPPETDADALFSILPSGETVVISKKAVTERFAGLLREARGPTLIACTGTFHGLPERPDIVFPSAVLNGLAESLLRRGRLGIFIPLAEQAETLAGDRARPGVEVASVVLRPGSDDAARRDAAARMAALKPDLVILDCFSYTRADKRAAEAALSCPVLLSVAVGARAAASLLPEA